MKNLTKTLLAVLAAGFVSSALSTQEAQAAKINGTIDFAGSVKLDTISLATATQIVQWRDVFGNLGFTNVAATTDDFNVIPLGTKATMATPWIFNPSTATSGLWSVGGFTFDLLNSTIVTQNAMFLDVKGHGTISGNGFDVTASTWAFTIQNAGGNRLFISFSANNATVPDGGSAVSLLSIGLGVIEFVRRKLRLRA
jgi:protein with PEP-CTERM/exosortase system signal